MVDLDRRWVLQTLGVIVAGTAAGLLPAGSASGNDAPGIEQVPGAEIDYETMTQAEIFELLSQRATRVTYRTFEDKVTDYEGGVLILFNSSCNRSETAERIDRNMGIAYLQLMERFDDAEVNGLPLRFAFFDVCGQSRADQFDFGARGVETHMYLDGKQLDRKTGGPVGFEDIGPVFRNMANYWIPLNLTEPNEDYTGLYQGTSDLDEVKK